MQKTEVRAKAAAEWKQALHTVIVKLDDARAATTAKPTPGRETKETRSICRGSPALVDEEQVLWQQRFPGARPKAAATDHSCRR